MRRTLALLSVLTLAVACAAPTPRPSKGICAKGTRFATIGTGDITGIYYPAGGSIAKIINKGRERHCMRLAVGSTLGSVYNINEVLEGELDFGIVQSDRQYEAYHGLAEWKEVGPRTRLRGLFSIHPETVILVAAVDAGIESVADLKGKRVNIGNEGSGQRQNAIDALDAAGLDHRTDMIAFAEVASRAPDLLQRGIIDAFFYTVGHPSAAIKEATIGKRKVRSAQLIGLDLIASKYPYYTKGVVPMKYYPGAENTSDVESFAVKATVVTTEDQSEELVYTVTKELFRNFAFFKTLHPAFEDLEKREMLRGMTAPFHPGAIRYYKEAGLWPPME